MEWNDIDKYSRAFRFAFGVGHVSIARALMLVAVGSRRHAFALNAADSAVFQAPVFNPRFGASSPAFVVAVAFPHRPKSSSNH